MISITGLRLRRRRSAVTLIEVCLAVLFLSLLFGSANGVMTYSRRETEKGFWIQQAITQLRNGTRAMTDMLKKTSYPSTIIKTAGGDEKVISFKEKRDYDMSGRLRNLAINPNKNFDMHAIISGSGALVPTFDDQTIMYFPVCEPEKDLEDGYTAGKINWVQLVLKPSKNYKTSGLGTLQIVEREETYNTKADPKRAFGLTSEFKDSIPVTRTREIIDDVREIEIDTYDIDELRGIFVTKEGTRHEAVTKRILISMNISCCHPKDKRIWLSDQCSVINNVELVKMAGSSIMQLIKIVSAGPGGSAVVKLNGADLSVNVGGAVGSYKVKAINSDSIILVQPGSDVERLLVKHED